MACSFSIGTNLLLYMSSITYMSIERYESLMLVARSRICLMLLVSSLVSSTVITSLLLVMIDPSVSWYVVELFLAFCNIMEVKLAVITRTISSNNRCSNPSSISRVKFSSTGDISSGITIVALRALVLGITVTVLPEVSSMAPSVVEINVLFSSVANVSMTFSLFVSPLDSVKTT